MLYHEISYMKEVWSEPLGKLAMRYGASFTNLKDICLKHRIPLPSCNYWEKVAAGIKVKKTHYRSISDSLLNEITIDGNHPLQKGRKSDEDAEGCHCGEKRFQSFKFKPC